MLNRVREFGNLTGALSRIPVFLPLSVAKARIYWSFRGYGSKPRTATLAVQMPLNAERHRNWDMSVVDWAAAVAATQPELALEQRRTEWLWQAARS